jgi:hypothetical protein
MTEHFVQFYENDAYLVNRVADFVRAGLQAGDAAIVIATKPHRDDLEKRLRADVSRVAAQRPHADRYVALDAADTLPKFIVDGEPDEGRFTALFEPIFKRATDSGNGRVRVFGEIVGLLCSEGKHQAAIRLEEFWNNFAKIHAVSLFCAYPIRTFPREADGAAFLTICNEHSRVGPAESYTPPANAQEHFRTIALLQQKAVALETEVAHRKHIEKALQRYEERLPDFPGGLP